MRTYFAAGRFALAWMAVGWGSVSGCKSTEAQAPARAPDSAAATPAVGPSSTAPGADGTLGYATDEPSGRGQRLSPRPKINAQATQAYLQGLEAFGRGDLNGAQSQFLQAIKADSRAYQAHYSLGVVRERLGDVDAASSSYLKALSIVRDFEPAIVAHATLLALNGRADDAERFLKDRLAKMPKSAAILATLAEVKSIQGDSGSAQRHAQESLKKNPDFRPAMVAIARDHYRNRRLDLALYSLKGILDGFGTENPARDKDNAEALLLRGLIYKEQGNRAGALENLRRAVALRPDLVEARLHLGTALLEAGNAGEAVQTLEAAARYDPNNVHVRLSLGDAYRLQGRTEEARKQLEWVAARKPELAQVHYNLGLLFLFGENIPGLSPVQAAEKAIEAFEKFKRLKSRADSPGDTDELITRAKSKKAILEAQQEEAAAAPAAAAPSSGEASAQPGNAPQGASTGSFPQQGGSTP